MCCDDGSPPVVVSFWCSWILPGASFDGNDPLDLSCNVPGVSLLGADTGSEVVVSASLSFTPLFDFLDCCWPITDADTDVEVLGCGDCDLDFVSREVITDSSGGASLCYLSKGLRGTMLLQQ